MIPRAWTAFASELITLGVLLALRKMSRPRANGTAPTQTVGERLREARVGHHDELHYRLNEAAHLLGIDQQTLAAMESGAVAPCDQILKKAHSVYGYHALWIANGVPPKRDKSVVRKTLALRNGGAR